MKVSIYYGFIYNFRFHPAIHRVKEILESKELGAIKNISVSMLCPASFLKDDDIRFDYSLGGGALMDLGCGCAKFLLFIIIQKMMMILRLLTHFFFEK